MLLNILLSFLYFLASAQSPPIQWFRFDNDAIQRAPAGFTLALSGVGQPPDWFVVRDETAPSQPNALAQPETDRDETRYPLCILDNIQAKNVACGVSFKIVRGMRDMSAGIVWRYLDKDNYYLFCIGALESRISLCKMERGQLTVLGTNTANKNAPPFIKPGSWYSMQVICYDRSLQVFVNRRRYFQHTDQTFSNPGKIGLWTKSGSYVQFDDMYVQVAN